ncbi:hypothetical protein GCM10007913_36930 [Devosia yakushimensis]|uniref:Uncharacterized protein n=1 Tax=Devosia yakushimensis TaxID=470028 RepID=A0ABQ5UIE4_9HYPH|nr:DUF6058 family natural product biosynthesis protein [Devosia yakushimensis]GLQ11761.1 hypothetical protein GCM10007913_36930 [Devosia yakushimensis]
MSDVDLLRNYVLRHFVPLSELAALANISPARVRSLIEARAIPGAIYGIWPNGAYFSPIGGHHGTPIGEPAHWYSPAAAWWLRRAHDLDAHAAADLFEHRFVADFVSRLAAEPDGALGYPGAWVDGSFSPAGAAATARGEWRDWIDGGYGVCLRHWDAYHAITKTCRRASIVRLTDEGRRQDLTSGEIDTLLDAMEQLDAVMLPFAPHQRPHGTPGLWIDAILVNYHLGRSRDQAQPGSPGRICA